MRQFWDFLARQFGAAARLGLVIGASVIVVATIVVGYLLLRSDYQVLFADMTPQDTLAMTTELDRLKIPYVLGEGDPQGNNTGTILVDKGDVYKTRIRLMGKDIPLHGAVGFELFNSSDMGMTEFAQKINYQRALQGELTRTILSLAEIRDAHVLLALPEQSLFKQATSKPKASVSVTVKQGQTLRAEQVAGIQRLVSAAVPGIVAQDVTIVDQSGVALTRPAGDGVEADAGSGASRLDLKKDTEAYLSRKATLILERALGPGQASASVDVTLNMDRVQSNLDELVGAPGKSGLATTGLITRERETSREVGGPLGSINTSAAAGGTLGGSNQRETEYALGHRLEQVISQPGSVRRIQVAVVVKRAMSAQQQEQLRNMVAAAVGASFDRGDAVVMQSADGLTSRATDAAAFVEASDSTGISAKEGVTRPAGVRRSSSAVASSTSSGDAAHWPSYLWVVVPVILFAIGLLMGPWIGLGRRPAASIRHLSELERQEVLARLQAWMQGASGQVTPAAAGYADAAARSGRAA